MSKQEFLDHVTGKTYSDALANRERPASAETVKRVQALEGLKNDLRSLIREKYPKTKTWGYESTWKAESNREPLAAAFDKLKGGKTEGVKPMEKPKFVYRMADKGSTELDPRSHAHATTSEAQAESYRTHREESQGKPQEIQKINLSKLKPSDYKIEEGPKGPHGEETQWIRILLKKLPAAAYEH